MQPEHEDNARGPLSLTTVGRRMRDRLDATVGGPARRRVIVVMAGVLAVAAADQGALSAIADQIQSYFGISKTELGLLGSITTAISAMATLPFGILVDRVVRTRLLGWSVVLWAAGMVAGAVATSYLTLLLSRVALGIVVAVAYPAVASLVGDYFPAAERGRVYGYVLTGEVIGTGAGIALAGASASVFGTWRAAMVALAVPAAGLSVLVLRLPEPARGGPSRMPAGQQRLLSAERVAQRPGRGPSQRQDVSACGDEGLAKEQIRAQDVQPHEDLILQRDPSRLRLPAAVRYVLRIRTNVIVIIASALGYFFFSGVRFFAIEFVRPHYAIDRGVAYVLLFVLGTGALAGSIAGGRVADRLLRRGRLDARILVPAVTFIVAAAVFAPGFITTSVGPAVGLFFVAALVFAASNAPLDAARLDIVPSRLWGRAEAIRTVIRSGLEAAAPVGFGIVADTVFGSRNDHGLRNTFLVMLLPLLVGGLILLIARHTYPRDVATADATERASGGSKPAREDRSSPG